MEDKAEYQTKALTIAQPLTPQIWEMISAVAPAMHKARLFGVSSSEQAMAIMLKGYELGLSLTASFEFIHAITVGGKTRAALSPRGHLALIVGNPLCASIKVEDQQDKAGNPIACTVTMERTNGFSYSVTATMDDALRAGLIKPGSGWEKWPANMLRWRATGFCADVVFGDIGGGMKRTDELGADLDQAGDTVVDATWTVTVQPETTTVHPETETVTSSPNTFTTVDALLSEWDASAIFNANGGRIPATEEECLKVAEVLSDAS